MYKMWDGLRHQLYIDLEFLCYKWSKLYLDLLELIYLLQWVTLALVHFMKQVYMVMELGCEILVDQLQQVNYPVCSILMGHPEKYNP